MIRDIEQIAREAGEVVRNGFGKHLDIQFKTGESNLVTQIDKASELLIVNFVKKNYSSHGILAEEGSNVKGSSDYLWVIDPLDGTTNFAHGLPIFSVSIGVQKNNETIAGVIYDVMKDELYSAEKGSGAFLNGNKINVSKNSILTQSLLVTGFPYDINDNPEHAFERFTALTKASRGMRRLGSAAVDFCYVARGIFDGFWEIHLHPWDMAAGMLIVEEAGGKVTDFESNPTTIYTKKVLATNGLIHKDMIEIITNY